MIPDLKARVEEIGVFYEASGLTPVESRLFAYLLLSDPPEVDFYTIQEFMGDSKSTISNALNRLMTEGRIDYITRPGDRRRYFRINSRQWLARIQSRLLNVTPLAGMLDRVLELRQTTNTPDFNAELQHIRRYFAHLEQELPRVVHKWEQQQD